MNFDPARCRRYVLSMVLCSPALHEAHANRAHFRKLVNGLETMIHGFGQQLCEFLIVEYLQRTRRWYLAHGAQMKAMVVIAVATLNEYGRVGSIFGVHFATHINQMNALAYVTAGLLDGAVAIDIA